MREIKFRYVFRRKEDGLINTVIADITHIESQKGNQLNIYFNPYWELVARNKYAGLMDKNGDEMYEGDIVEAIAIKEYSEKSCVSDVIFSINDLQYQIRGLPNQGNSYNHGLPLTWGGWKSIEVIGNIYENHDLLEDVV